MLTVETLFIFKVRTTLLDVDTLHSAKDTELNRTVGSRCRSREADDSSSAAPPLKLALRASQKSTFHPFPANSFVPSGSADGSGLE